MTRLILPLIAPVAALALLPACSTVSAQEEEYPAREPQGQCDAAGVQDLIGQRATQELGATLLTQTGARVLRWVPPGTAVTMDYRPDRLTVSYDATMMIERISCG
ncbi:I78 family peptidase inhibitor [Alteraurantiacibacter aestuarii]|uniref:Peptidase inhibitor I78 n=1 Tax=Alteraurantiacibacter aestuarii TaxID=650004 RepID=A0A844ZJ63_9SPHN|nr:I78 family peptidase inhibitor [Alteraurantiacibacter aestuarii]MXO87483.1 hypothetical protein [Alteraurantiacibacter aestuarii]